MIFYYKSKTFSENLAQFLHIKHKKLRFLRKLLVAICLIFILRVDFGYSQSTCPENTWLQLSQSCFKVFTNKRTAYEAQLACFEMNAYLATVNSQSEFNSFKTWLQGQGSPTVWVDYVYI